MRKLYIIPVLFGGSRSTAPDYSEGSNDFRSILLRIKKDNPDALFLNAASVETLGPMVKQIDELKMSLPLYSFAYPSVPTFINQYAQFAEGIIFLSPPHINETTEVSAQFRSAFLKHAGRAPNVPFVAATAYDGATALTSALELSNRKESTKTINVLNDYDSHGVLGRIRFDENGDAIGINYQLQTIRNGAMKPLPQ